MSTTVKTQKELDAALAKPGWAEIIIDSPHGVRLEVSDSNGKEVTAYGSSTVTASDHTAVHLHSKQVALTGGVVIDHTTLDLSSYEAWASYHGTEIVNGEVIAYKAVNDDLKSARGFVYPIGETVEAPDWKPGDFCGNGLHLSPSPVHAQYYFDTATRFLKCAVPVGDSTLIAASNIANVPKLKAKSVRVISEVDVHGRVI